ncbi:MAG: type II toxin-antitoxin system VapC family toxin [Tepidisphaeraceae bacterium]
MIFVDTWAWLALAYARDPYHAAAVWCHQRLLRDGRRYVTTDYVLCETISSLFGVVPFAQAERFVGRLLASLDAGDYELQRITPSRFQEAWRLRRRYHDKPDISFTDLTSIAVMRERDITDVFTGDAHFAQVGLGFRLFPQRP